MTLAEVSQIAKYFKISGASDYVCINQFGRLVWSNGTTYYNPTSEELTRTDWEVVSIKKELSASDIRSAIDTLNSDENNSFNLDSNATDLLITALELE